MKRQIPRRRQKDNWRGALCWCAARASEFWEFIDKRQIDKHALSVGIFYGTVKVTMWAMQYAETYSGDGQVAFNIAAVTAPYMALQAAGIGFYFKR